MDASLSSAFRAPARRTWLIVAAVLAVGALATAAVLLEPAEGGALSVPAAAGGPVQASVGDPSVPSAASVFRDRSATTEEPVVAF